MTHVIKTLIRLVFLSVLWLLVRSVQFLLELSELSWEACEVSNAELFLQVKIRQLVQDLVPKFLKV